MAKQFDEGLTSAAFGLAPMGAQPQGQPAGEMYPGNPRMQIDTGNPNPSDRAMRIDALYNTIERNDIKSEAGERMMHQLLGNGRRAASITPNVRRAIEPQDNSGPRG
jgi:hypothetical protein